MIKNQQDIFFEWASKGMNIFHLYHQRKTFETVHFMKVINQKAVWYFGWG